MMTKTELLQSDDPVVYTDPKQMTARKGLDTVENVE